MTKIVGVGMHKTGTTSLGAALRVLGYRWSGWCKETASLYKRGHKEALVDMMEDFDCFEDAPWFLLYQEAWRRYPDMKLILTHRADMDLWFQSLVKHNDRHAADAYSFRSLIYGTEDLRDKKDHAIATHEAHIAEVRRFASENDVPLIELCWENGDGWEQLCHFLGTDVPNQPFPHANAAPKVSLLKRAIKGVVE